jgi:putative Mg2+ transporter-C (MgtC) family protein
MEAILEALQPELLRPMLLAIVLGGLIGFEREIHGRPAGLRTHILVCLTSTLLILASKHVPAVLFPDSGGDARIVFDPNRLAAGIMTGIGFLGAASIIRSGDHVRGITTGATVWTVAGLGVVIGQGEQGLAFVATMLVLAMLVGLDRVAHSLAPVVYRRVIVRGRGVGLGELAQRVRRLLEGQRIRVMDLSGRNAAGTEPFELVFVVRAREVLVASRLLEELCGEDGVETVEWTQLG